MKKRAPIRRIPYYAQQACGGEVAYESACACMGVFSSVVSASASAQTTTLAVVSVTASTVTETQTVSTESSTKTVSTETVTRTVATEIVATSVSVAEGPFYIQVIGQYGTGSYDLTGTYAILDWQDGFPESAARAFNASNIQDGAQLFYIDGEGFLRADTSGSPQYDDYY